MTPATARPLFGLAETPGGDPLAGFERRMQALLAEQRAAFRQIDDVGSRAPGRRAGRGALMAGSDAR